MPAWQGGRKEKLVAHLVCDVKRAFRTWLARDAVMLAMRCLLACDWCFGDDD
jgi:hypothetical protein